MDGIIGAKTEKRRPDPSIGKLQSQNTLHALCERPPFRPAVAQRPFAGRSDLVILTPSAIDRLPVRADEPLLFEPVQRRVKAPLFQLEVTLGTARYGLSDLVAVRRP